MGRAESPPNFLPSLRTEIIESQKAEVEFMRWKLLASGGVGYLTIAQSGDHQVVPAVYRAWLLVLVPLICLYCDLVCTHLQLRIQVIGSHLRQLAVASGSGTMSYESFVDTLREHRGLDNPFAVESVALFGSTFLLTVVAAAAALQGPTDRTIMIVVFSVSIGLFLGLLCWRRHLLKILRDSVTSTLLGPRP